MYFSSCLFNWILNFYFADDEINRAVENGNLDILKVLLAKRENKNPVIFTEKSLGNDFTVLHRAAFYGHENIFRWYQEKLNYPDINPLNSNGWYTPMLQAAELGKLNVVKYIEAVQGG